jgi:hypothetical protein
MLRRRGRWQRTVGGCAGLLDGELVPGDRGLRLLQPGQAHVQNLHHAARERVLAVVRSRHEQVIGLDVAVHHAALVGMLQPKGDLADVIAGLGQRRRAVVLHHLGQIHAVHELHGKEVRLADLIRVVGNDDVGMRELGRRLHLAVEALDGVGVRQPFAPDQLQGHDPVHPLMPGFEDLAGRPLAETLDDTVRPEHQISAPAFEDLFRLERRKPAALHQLVRQKARMGRRSRPRSAATQLFQLCGLQESTLAQQLHKASDGLDSHRRNEGGVPKRGSGTLEF